jgi:hypothetical protein
MIVSETVSWEVKDMLLNTDGYFEALENIKAQIKKMRSTALCSAQTVS